MKLALKVKALNKYKNSITIKSMAKEGFDKGSKNPSDITTTLKPQVKREVHKPQQERTSKSGRCFKCQ